MEWAQQFVEQYGYWAVFIWTFIEGESVFLVAAGLAAAGVLETWKVIVVAASGAFIGHMFFFALGRWKGKKIIRAVPALRRHAPKANVILNKYAHWSIFIFQYLYGTRLAAAILFGCSSIEFWRFFLLQAINCITWSIVIYTIGHFLGMTAMGILHKFGVWGLVIVVTTLAIAAAVIYWRYGHHHVKRHLNSNQP